MIMCPWVRNVVCVSKWKFLLRCVVCGWMGGRLVVGFVRCREGLGGLGVEVPNGNF